MDRAELLGDLRLLPARRWNRKLRVCPEMQTVEYMRLCVQRRALQGHRCVLRQHLWHEVLSVRHPVQLLIEQLQVCFEVVVALRLELSEVFD
mmetsp:Transcript_51513/g.130169  ORF Transcript_51513/g.130169 Transcript_51513/m.130169 type:complete len:92 (-) Transcript_51513:3-278(-)